ncbi:MAG: PAS domain S-box protein [Proteobacteria bacterium]|nr:PAS domain S-box protein [Pseudomonadota bacterium]
MSRFGSTIGRLFDRTKESAGDVPNGAAGPPPWGLDSWRERILTAFFLTVVILGGLAYVPSMIYLVTRGHWVAAGFDTVAVAWAVVALVWRRKIGLAVRAGVTVTFIYALAVVILAHLGPYSGGPIWLFAFGVAAGVLFGLRAALAALALNALTLAVFGGLLAGGWLTWAEAGPETWPRWLVLAGNFILLNALIGVSVAALARGLQAALRQEKRALADLVQEVDERRRAESAIWEEKERFRVLVDESPLGVSLIDPRGRYLYVNPKFTEMFGYTLADVPTGRDWFQRAFPDPDYRREVASTWRGDLETSGPGEARPRTFNVTTRDGTEKLIQFRPVGLETVEQLVMYEDVTQRHRAAEALRASDKRYRDLFNSISDFIVTHDLEGRLLAVNRAVADIAGLPAEALVGRPITDFIPLEHQDDFFTDYLARTRDQGRAEGVFKIRPGRRREYYVEFRSALVRDESGQTYVSSSGRDVTERILAEREVRALEEQLLQAQKMEAIGTLASGIAHDFNNVLQAVGGYLQLIKMEEAESGGASRYLPEIERAVERAGDLVRHMLTFSRKVDRKLMPVDLNQQVTQAINMLQRTLPKMIRVEARLSEDLRPVQADPTQIEQVIMNLGANAKDAMPDGGDLILETQNATLDGRFWHSHPDLTPGEYVRLRVADTGCGMAPETLPHVFEPFFTTKAPGHGTGLGLSTVYGIVRGHGGLVICHSRLDEGTTFDIYVPALAAEVAVQAAAPEGEEKVRGGHETILLADDETAVVDIGRRILERSGYTMLTADSGEEALDIYRKRAEEIDAVILDMSMPGMGGYACLEQILAFDPAAKIIVVSGYTAELEVKKIIDAGARAFLGKPHRLGDLLQKVRHVLDQGPEGDDRGDRGPAR